MIKTLLETLKMGSSHSHSHSQSLTLQSAVVTVDSWCCRPSDDLVFDSNRCEINRFCQAVECLLQSAGTQPIDGLIAKAITRLKTEFEAVLRRQTDLQAGPASTTESSWIADSTANLLRYEDYSIPEPPIPDVMSYLRNIARIMNSAGRIEEIIRVYRNIRNPFLKVHLHQKLRFRELNIGNDTSRYVWDELKVKMELWIQVSKICIKKLFQREKLLCDQIFSGIGDNNNSAKDQCFAETVNKFADSLFSFVDTMSNTDQGYDRMETVLALYIAFVEVLRNADASALFDSLWGDEIRNMCAVTLSRIESGVAQILHEFENTVLHEDSNVLEQQGEIDYWTKYVMDKINVVVRSRGLLSEFIKSAPNLNFGNVTIREGELGDTTDRNFVRRHLILILVVLQKNLDEKSKMLGDPSLQELFKMINLHYIVGKVEASRDLQQMIGDSYYNELKGNLNDAVSTYKALTCSKFLKCFDDNGLYSMSCFCIKPRASKTMFRKKLADFNIVYEETQNLHLYWTIPNAQLREDVRVSLSEELVPAYRRFLHKFQSNLKIEPIRGSNGYSPEDLEALLCKKMFSVN